MLDDAKIYGSLFEDVPEELRIQMAYDLLRTCESVPITEIESLLQDQLLKAEITDKDFDWEAAL